MKKLLLSLVIALPCFANAQQDDIIIPKFTIPRSIIKLAPLQFFSNTLEIGVESFNKGFTRSFDGSVGFRSGADVFDKGRGMSLELGYRKYVSGMKIHVRKERQFYQGIYYNVALKVAYFKGEHYDYYYYDPNTGNSYNEYMEETTQSIAPSFTLGLQKTLWQIIFLDVFVGGGIRFSESDRTYNQYFGWYNDNTIFSPGYDGIYPKVGVKIGVGL
jgi:hypothetical protein